MGVTISMVTVTFVGLVHFATTTTPPGREVIVPLAAHSVVQSGVTQEVHSTSVVITGLKGGRNDCEMTLHGKWDMGKNTCTLSHLAGKVIDIPDASGGFTTTGQFGQIPKLSVVCPSITRIRREYLTDPKKYAVRMTVTHGQLDACPNGKAWVSTLTTDGITFSITGARPVPLNADANVTISNSPIGMGGPPQAHFGWYYVMYLGAGTCGAVPAEPTIACLMPLVGASGDVGCSNSNYP